MPDEKVTRILRSMGISPESIAKMSNREAWGHVYDARPKTPKKPRDNREQVCFTGFMPWEKQELQNLAQSNNLKACTSVTKHLHLLITGEDPGPKKLEKATQQGTRIITEAQFRRYIQTRATEPPSSRQFLDPPLMLKQAPRGSLPKQGHPP